MGKWTRVFGIWLYGADPYSPSTLQGTVQDNRVHKTDYAIWLTGPKWTSTTVIEENTLVNNCAGIILEGYPSGTPKPPPGVTIEDNTIKNYWWWDILYNY